MSGMSKLDWYHKSNINLSRTATNTPLRDRRHKWSVDIQSAAHPKLPDDLNQDERGQVGEKGTTGPRTPAVLRRQDRSDLVCV